MRWWVAVVGRGGGKGCEGHIKEWEGFQVV